jgi:integrase/recombinase XerD
MKPACANALARALFKYFQEYLPTLRGMSPHTVHSYRDAIVLFLRFAAARQKRPVDRLDLDDLSLDTVTEFLADLEQTRHCCVATRNARLAALHTFARFAASQAPEHLAELQRVLAVPFKRGPRRGPVEFLTQQEVKQLLATPTAPSPQQERDLTLFALMLNTGARVQEVLDLRVKDVRFEPPYQVCLHGKGGKTRLCPIWAHTAKRLQRMLAASHWPVEPDRPVFLNRVGEKLSRFGVHYLLRKRLARCAEEEQSFRGRRIHPHTLRHTTAVHLLKAGVDFATISHWLGHASLNTTMAYARADMDLKRQALARIFPDAPRPPRKGRARDGVDVVAWLQRL